jgi:hypothetical protein
MRNLGVLAGNDFTQDIKINVVQFVDIKTCNGFLVLAEPGGGSGIERNL